METVAKLFEGQRMVAKTGFKARVSWFLALLHALKEALKGQVYPLDHILEHLRGHFGQIRAAFFAARQLGTLIFIGERNACHAIGAFALIKGSIIHLTAQPQPAFQRSLLLVRRIESELIGFRRFLLFWGLFSLRHAFVAQSTL